MDTLDLDLDLASLSAIAVPGRLREALRLCKRLVVLVTPSTPRSSWIPWELGVADGQTGVASVATLPLHPAEHDEAWWDRCEYYAMYPRIEPESRSDGASWVVRHPSMPTRSLRAWLAV